MSILQLPLPIAANTGVTPNIKTMKVTDSLADVKAAGYLNAQNLQGYTISPEDEIHVKYNANPNDDNQGDFTIMKASISNGVITLSEDFSEGNVELPVTVNHIATYVNTTGKIGEDPVLAISDGDIQAGDVGSAGGFISQPGTAATGSLKFEATSNTGDFDMTLTNVQLAQASNFYLSDPQDADGYIQVSQVPSDPCSNLFYVDVNFNYLQLQSAGRVTVVPAQAGARYRVREVFSNNSSSGTAFSGGDLDVQLADGTSTFCLIKAALLQSPANARWGDTNLEYPTAGDGGTLAISVAGAEIFLEYDDAGSEYTDGNLAITILFERVE